MLKNINLLPLFNMGKMIRRDLYLQRLMDRHHNGFVKIITGIRRCGKSYLLFKIFKRQLLSSAVGSLTNAKKLADTITTERQVKTNQPTVCRYLDLMEDSYLFNRVKRYDVKGRRYLASPEKFYAEDLGLRNVRLNLRQYEETHLMENAIYNELVSRGCSVDVGVVEYVTRVNGKQEKRQAEIDFIVNLGTAKVYVQSAFAIPDAEKRGQETVSLVKSGDFFRKIVVVSGFREPTSDESGIVYVGVIPFLLDPSILLGS